MDFLQLINGVQVFVRPQSYFDHMSRIKGDIGINLVMNHEQTTAYVTQDIYDTLKEYVNSNVM